MNQTAGESPGGFDINFYNIYESSVSKSENATLYR